MVNQPNVADWMQAWAAVVTAVASIVLLIGVFLTRTQIKLAKQELESVIKWNRMNATFTFITGEQFLDRERSAARALRTVGVDLYTSSTGMSAAEVAALLNDPEAFGDVKDFMNTIEDYAMAVRANALDSEAAYEMMSHLLIRYYAVLAPVVDERRKIVNDDTIHCEFENLAITWQRRSVMEREQQAAARGVSPRV